MDGSAQTRASRSARERRQAQVDAGGIRGHGERLVSATEGRDRLEGLRDLLDEDAIDFKPDNLELRTRSLNQHEVKHG